MYTNNGGIWGYSAEITINGGKLEGSSGGSWSYLICSLSSSDTNVDVTINGGEFISHTDYSYLTNVYGVVVINDCSFVAENYWEAFNMSTSTCSVTVKGGTFALNGVYESEPALAGLVFHRKSPNFWTSTSGTLLVDPAEGKTVKVNQETDSFFIAGGAAQSAEKDAEGYYTITRTASSSEG